MAVLDRALTPLVKQVYVTSAVCLNILGHGCVLGFVGILLPQLERPDAIIPLDDAAKSWLASVMMIPILCGNFSMPTIMDRFGRKLASICVIVTSILGWIMTTAADSLWMLFLGRILLGIAFGLNLPLRAILIGEYSSPRYRGAFLMSVALAQAIGIFTVHTLGSFIFWQKTALICISFHFISLILMIYAPESPSFLAMKGRTEECKKVFRWLRGEDEEEELQLLIEARSFKEKGLNFRETVKKKEFYKPVSIMIHANSLTQFSGATIFAAYAVALITMICGTDENASFWMIFLDAQRIVSNIFAIYLIKRFKRRTMLFSISGLSIAVHLTIAAYVYARNHKLLPYNSLWIPILLVNIQTFTVATGMVPLPQVIAGEIFPYEYRGLGGSVSILSMSAASFFVLKTFPYFSTNIGVEGIYTMNAFAMTYFAAFMWFLLPETKDKTLQEIEETFTGTMKNEEDGAEPLKEEDDMRRKVSVYSYHSLTAEL